MDSHQEKIQEVSFRVSNEKRQNDNSDENEYEKSGKTEEETAGTIL